MTEENSAPEVTKPVIRPKLENYVRAKSGTGKRTHRTDDVVARTLDGKTLDDIKAGAQTLGIDHSKWAHLNNGQQRMLIGNALRARLTAKKEEERLSEKVLADVLGEPVAPYDAEKAEADAKAAAEKREADKAAKETAKAEKAAANAAKAAEKQAAKEAAEAAKAGGDTLPEPTKAKRGKKADAAE